MLRIEIPETNLFNETTFDVIHVPAQTLKLEHSLLSIHRWESKWHKSYLSTKQLTSEENLDYIRCMCIDPNVNQVVFQTLRNADFKRIRAYIDDPMSAVKYHDDPNKKKRSRYMTSETIYGWMVSYGIPFECEKWHLNQLLALIEICGRQNTPRKKADKRAIAMRYADINKARKAKTGSKG